ncbi:hypothetical protein ABK040_015080 [Willaertia magna]
MKTLLSDNNFDNPSKINNHHTNSSLNNNTTTTNNNTTNQQQQQTKEEAITALGKQVSSVILHFISSNKELQKSYLHFQQETEQQTEKEQTQQEQQEQQEQTENENQQPTNPQDYFPVNSSSSSYSFHILESNKENKKKIKKNENISILKNIKETITTNCEKIISLIKKYGHLLPSNLLILIIKHFNEMNEYKLNILILFIYFHYPTLQLNLQKMKEINLKNINKNGNLDKNLDKNYKLQLSLLKCYNYLFESCCKLKLFEQLIHLFNICLKIITLQYNSLQQSLQNNLQQNLQNKKMKEFLQKRNEIINCFVFNFCNFNGPLIKLYPIIENERNYRIQFFKNNLNNLNDTLQNLNLQINNNTLQKEEEENKKLEIFKNHFDIQWESKTLQIYFFKQNENLNIVLKLYNLLKERNLITRLEFSEMIKKLIFKFKSPDLAEKLIIENFNLQNNGSINNNSINIIKPTLEDYSIIISGYLNNHQITKAFNLLNKMLNNNNRLKYKIWNKKEITNFITMILILIKRNEKAQNLQTIAYLSAEILSKFIYYNDLKICKSYLLAILKEIKNEKFKPKYLLDFLLHFNDAWKGLGLKDNVVLIDSEVCDFVISQFNYGGNQQYNNVMGVIGNYGGNKKAAMATKMMMEEQQMVVELLRELLMSQQLQQQQTVNDDSFIVEDNTTATIEDDNENTNNDNNKAEEENNKEVESLVKNN